MFQRSATVTTGLPSPTRCPLLAVCCHGEPQAPGAHVGPVLLDVVEALAPPGRPERGPPTGRHLGEHRPERVLLLLVDQDVELPVVVVERVRAHCCLTFWTCWRTWLRTRQITAAGPGRYMSSWAVSTSTSRSAPEM